MLCVLTVTASVLNALIFPKDSGIKRRLHRVEKAWGWRNGRQKFINNLTDSRFCMSQQCKMVTKKSGHNCVCTFRYKVCRIKNVRDDGLFLFCVDQSPPGIGHLFFRKNMAEAGLPHACNPKKRKDYDWGGAKVAKEAIPRRREGTKGMDLRHWGMIFPRKSKGKAYRHSEQQIVCSTKCSWQLHFV